MPKSAIHYSLKFCKIPQKIHNALFILSVERHIPSAGAAPMRILLATAPFVACIVESKQFEEIVGHTDQLPLTAAGI